MKVVINKEACIGCGACNAVSGDVFGFDDEEQKATVKVEEVPEDKAQEVESALEGCPTSAISAE